VFIDTSLSPSPKLRQFSEEMGGGQMGFVLMRGNNAPVVKDEPTRGGGSMKDIEVLDDMDELQEWLRANTGISPYCVIDVMKTIRIHEAAIPEAVAQMPDPIQDNLNQTLGLSFWEAIQISNADETSIWGWRYGKSQQDSMINIFYNSITIEMLGLSVSTNMVHFFSRSLIYISIPMDDSEDSLSMVRDINELVDSFPVAQSTSDILLIGEQGLTSQNLAWMFEVLFLFVILTIGILVFALSLHKIRKEGKGEDDGVQPFIPDYEVGLKGDYSEQDYSPHYDPYNREPPYN
jgi:hypothetical protein